MPAVVLTADSGRRLEIDSDRVTLRIPDRSARRVDGHVLAAHRIGGKLTQGGTFSARPSEIPLRGFDAADVRAACLANGWDWRVRGTIERGEARVPEPVRAAVRRVWMPYSQVRSRNWPYVLIAGLGLRLGRRDLVTALEAAGWPVRRG